MSIHERYPLPEIPNFNIELHEELFEEGVNNKYIMMQDIIDNFIYYKDTLPKRIATIQNNLNGRESYFMHKAVLKLFESRGLLEEFYDDGSLYKERKHGWELELYSPLQGEKYTEQFRFISKDLKKPENGTTHFFALYFQLIKR